MVPDGPRVLLRRFLEGHHRAGRRRVPAHIHSLTDETTIVKIQRYPQGSRVRVHPGRFPMDPALTERVGTIVHHERRSAEKYGVQLDGESEIRVFAEDELTLESDAGSVEELGEPRGGSGSDTSF